MYLPRRVGNPEPWQMTQEQFIEESLKHIKHPSKRHALKLAHAEYIASAIKAGKKIPDHVMKDYSDDQLYKFYPPWKKKNPEKESWQKTRDEYVAEAMAHLKPHKGKPSALSDGDREWAKPIHAFENAHAEAVARALKEGKPIPAEVLKYYLAHPLTESTFPWANKNPGKQPWEMTRSEFRRLNLTGTISDSSYRGMTSPERLSEGINKNEYGTFVTQKKFGDKRIEIRKGSSGLPSAFKEVAAFDGDKRVGYAVNEYGATAVFVADNYQKLGIGTALLDEFQKQFPDREIGQVTTAGYNMVGSYHKKLVQRAISEGKTIPAPVLDDYTDLKKNPGKQPWEMTRGEWLIDVAHYWKENNINQGRKLDLMIGLDMQAALHKLLVKDAVQEGKPVPAAVLKDYPKLIPAPGKRKEEWQMTKTEYADAMIMKGKEMMRRAEKYRREATPGNFNLYTKQGQKINEKASYLIQGGLAIKKPSQPPYADNWGNPHKTVVEGALMKGKPVPAEVLKDYPELKGKY
jgi:GNAT superfamily N-acetyltransferase